jgi:hypothetical protein
MYLAAVKCRGPVSRIEIKGTIDNDIRDFVAGRNDGEDLLHALYDHVLDEPIPERLLSVLRG